MMKQFGAGIATCYEMVVACHWVKKLFSLNIEGSVIRCNESNKVLHTTLSYSFFTTTLRTCNVWDIRDDIS
jgi:hypothetical protein